MEDICNKYLQQAHEAVGLRIIVYVNVNASQ